MRILSVIETLLHGGAETVLVDLVRGLPQHEHRVVHFSASNGAVPHPWIADALAAQNGVVTDDVHWRDFRKADTRAAVLGAFEPDVVLFHWWGQHPLRPWIESVSASAPPDRPRFVAVLHRSGVPAPPGFDAYVLVTPSQMPQVSGIDPARVHVIPNGVDLSRFETIERRPRGGGPFVIGRLSGLREGKIPADWVQTADAFGLEDVRWVIAGDGPLRAAFQSDVERLGAAGRFLLPGYIPRSDVPRLLSTFDVFCYVTSTAVECHPLALLEAAAAGVPIVAEARGGVPDIVRDGVSGLLVDDLADIGRCLRLLQRDEDLRARLGHGARQVAEQHSLTVQVARYAALLDTLDAFLR